MVGRALLWRRAEILLMAGAEPWVVCLICERRFRSLGPHLAKTHGVTAAEYRSEHQLRASLPLTGDQTRSRLVETTRAAMDADPGWTQRMRAAMPPLEVIAQASGGGQGRHRQPAPGACRPRGRRSCGSTEGVSGAAASRARTCRVLHSERGSRGGGRAECAGGRGTARRWPYHGTAMAAARPLKKPRIKPCGADRETAQREPSSVPECGRDTHPTHPTR